MTTARTLSGCFIASRSGVDIATSFFPSKLPVNGGKELAARLDPDRFVQVHRSHIVNLDELDHLEPYDERRLLVVLRDGSQIVPSRAASERLRNVVR
jgi:hypothetical protein